MNSNHEEDFDVELLQLFYCYLFKNLLPPFYATDEKRHQASRVVKAYSENHFVNISTLSSVKANTVWLVIAKILCVESMRPLFSPHRYCWHSVPIGPEQQSGKKNNNSLVYVLETVLTLYISNES